MMMSGMGKSSFTKKPYQGGASNENSENSEAKTEDNSTA